MQVNNINTQNFNGGIFLPAGMESKLERNIYKILNHENKEISAFSELIKKLGDIPNTNIRIVRKQGISNPLKDADFDVFIENTAKQTQKIATKGTSLAERFLNALYEVTK